MDRLDEHGEIFNDPRWAVALIRATVLEAAHPQIGAALVDHSSFVTHPWRRPRNTFTSTQRMFGPDDEARRRESARLNRLHGRMNGTDARNRPYRSSKPSCPDGGAPPPTTRCSPRRDGGAPGI
ncbi:oxygenase MpaB family protein, partial [Streptomyces griseoluteus]